MFPHLSDTEVTFLVTGKSVVGISESLSIHLTVTLPNTLDLNGVTFGLIQSLLEPGLSEGVAKLNVFPVNQLIATGCEVSLLLAQVNQTAPSFCV